MLCYGLVLFLISATSLTSSSTNIAHHNGSNNNGTYRVYIGGLFDIFRPFHHKTSCNKSNVMEISLLRLEMALFTMNGINQNETILPGVELVLVPKQTCVSNSVALSQVLNNFSCNSKIKTSTKGIIGPRTSAMSLSIATLLGLMKLPQISYRATADEFSNKERYPYFFRTVPADSFQIKAIVELLKHFEWYYVSFVYEDDEYGRNAYDYFVKLIRRQRICVHQKYKLPATTNATKIKRVAQSLLGKKAKVVVTFLLETNLVTLFQEIHKLQNNSEKIQWIGSDSWRELISTDMTITSQKYEPRFNTPASIISDVIDGAIQFEMQSPTNPAFNNYLRSTTRKEACDLNPEIYKYLNRCDNESLSTLFHEKENSSFLWEEEVSNAVLAFAYGLDNALNDLCRGRKAVKCKEFTEMKGSKLRNYLRKVSFQTSMGGKFLFDLQQNALVRYDVQVFQKKSLQWKLIGKFFKNQTLDIDEKAVEQYNLNEITSKCSNTCKSNEYKEINKEKKCCWSCKTCESNHIVKRNESIAGDDPPCEPCNKTQKVVDNICVELKENFLSFNSVLGGIIAAASGLGIMLTLLVAFVYFRFRHTPIIRASGRELSAVMLIGVLSIFLCMFSFCLRPTNLLCGVRRITVGLFFTVIFSGLLLKSVRISLIFNKFGKEMVKDYKILLRPIPQVVIALILISVEVFVLCVWFITSPPYSTVNVSPLDDSSQRYTFYVCNDLHFGFLMIGSFYPILLLIACLILAIQIRKVPSGFNEAKYIGFAVYTTLIIWLVRLATFYSEVSPNVEIRDGVFCLCILLNNFIVLVTIFAPRVRVVLFRSEKNNEEAVLGHTNNSHFRLNLVKSHSANDDLLQGVICSSCGQVKPIKVETLRRRSLPTVIPESERRRPWFSGLHHRPPFQRTKS